MSHHWPGYRSLTLALLLGGVLLSGCQTNKPTVKPAPTVSNAALFQVGLEQATVAVRQGDLDEATRRLNEARKYASDPADHRKVRSVENLIEGANALINGDGAKATLAWSRIEDPTLKREVRIRARAIGIDVPAQQ